MSAPSTSCSIWIENGAVCLKVGGRATFACSVDFRAVIHRLGDEGHRRFLLDLTECVSMDSTFLGVLAGFGQRLASESAGAPGGQIVLLNANPRIRELLENLGVEHLFQIVDGAAVATGTMKAVPHTPQEASRREVSEVCLEAHTILMALNPANVPKFKDVTRFLTEDLKRMNDPNH
ncbi:MAG TPA: STAS domain-containing protein [Methylomirabilota bacterium]|nr:STAS domain-containing protein [Methylomirabilota bacterium]